MKTVECLNCREKLALYLKTREALQLVTKLEGQKQNSPHSEKIDGDSSSIHEGVPFDSHDFVLIPDYEESTSVWQRIGRVLTLNNYIYEEIKSRKELDREGVKIVLSTFFLFVFTPFFYILSQPESEDGSVLVFLGSFIAYVLMMAFASVSFFFISFHLTRVLGGFDNSKDILRVLEYAVGGFFVSSLIFEIVFLIASQNGPPLFFFASLLFLLHGLLVLQFALYRLFGKGLRSIKSIAAFFIPIVSLIASILLTYSVVQVSIFAVEFVSNLLK